MLGKPIIKGTRITVEQILNELSIADSIDEILLAHPHINREQIHAALAFAAQTISGDEIYPVAI